MFSIESLRAKTVLSALIPTALVLAVVAIIVLYAHEQATRDVIQQRDAELARMSAARLSEALSRYSQVLQSIAAEDDVRTLEPARLSVAREKAENWLNLFDAGVVVYDSEGVALWAQPFAVERQGTDFPVPSEFDRVRSTLRPAFSDAFKDAISGEEVILVGVPIVGRGAEFKGVLAGMFKMKSPSLGAIYAEVLQLKTGRSGYTYLVDGSGRVIYHPDGSQIGRDLAATLPVVRAIGGETGAVLAEDPTGERVISGFAPVPGTGWSVITQERWEDVIRPIRGWGTLLLGLLLVAGILSAALIFFAIGRILKPIQELTHGARRIAAGDFDYAFTAKTGDELQTLAEQFNAMAQALKESYAELEQKIATRTEALRQSERRYRDLVETARDAIYTVSTDGTFTSLNPAFETMTGWPRAEWIGKHFAPMVHPDDLPLATELFERVLQGETVPIFELRVRSKSGEYFTVEALSTPQIRHGKVVGALSVARDITERVRAEKALRELAVLEERGRLARELHDSVTQSLYSVTLFAEAARRLVGIGDEGRTRSYLKQLGETAQQALKEMRLLVYELRPSGLEQEGLAGALEQRLSAVEERAGVEARLLVEGTVDLPKSVEEGLYRIAQEALNNALKHAAASSVTVRIRAAAEVVELEVADDGKGFDPDAVGDKGGMGLVSMRERAERLGGTLRVVSAPGEGTKVQGQVRLG